VAVITHIGLDHVNILGDTLAKIASEKAGILKPGTVCCVTGVVPGEALDAIRSKAAAEGVPVRRVVPAASAEAVASDVFATYAVDPLGNATITLSRANEELINLRLALRGPFQANNAATAAAALVSLREHGIAIGYEALRTGLERAVLPGRFQIVRDGSDYGPALVLDGAHNEDGARVLKEAIASTFPGRAVTLVLGCRNNHDPAPFLRVLAPLQPRRVIATTPSFKPRPADEVAQSAQALGLSTTIIEEASVAIEQTLHAAGPDEVIVVTGSFYTVGETPPHLRGIWSTEPQ
jgi:dihydrofolate synthase/folylpolyglutamate synthase